MISQITPDIYTHVLNSTETKVFYQPIVSISKSSVIGHESLLRAEYYGVSVPPDLLFSFSSSKNDLIELDNLCQILALKEYKTSKQNSLLFINMETALLEYYVKHAPAIVAQIDSLQIERNKIVIEINEKRATNDALLLELVTLYRQYGFIIALDDVGAGYSNLNRIVLARPDIIKIDRSVITNVHLNYYKQEVIKAISELGQKIGAIAIAEGVEEELEVIACVECGVDWFQGYYFSKAMNPIDTSTLCFKQKCTSISTSFQKKFLQRMNQHTAMISIRKKTFNILAKIVLQNFPVKSDVLFYDFLSSFNELECIYLINHNGIQITDTMFDSTSFFRNRTMFSPMKKGDNHVSKPFFNYAIHNPGEIYFSEKYISLATGNYCHTISKLLSPKENQTFILCADFKTT